MPVGDSLATSFNQDNAEKQRSTHAKQDDQAAAFKQKKDKELGSKNPFRVPGISRDENQQKRLDREDGETFSPETFGMPPNATMRKADDQAAAFKRKTIIDMDRIQHTTVGNEVAYTKGQGTIVSKKGAYVTIYNKDANAYDQVHAGETYIPGDTISMGIMNQLWDQMAMETRTALLSKALVAQPEYYVGKTWNDLPLNLKEVLKLSPSYTSVGSKYGNPPKGAHIDSTGKKPKVLQPGSKDPFADDSHTATSGQSRSTKPTRSFRSVDGKPKDMTERQAATYDKKVPKHLRDDPSFSAGETTVGGKHLNQTKPDKSKKPAAAAPKEDKGAGTFAQGLDKSIEELEKALIDAKFSALMLRIKAEGDLELNADEAANPDNSIIRRKKPDTTKSDANVDEPSKEHQSHNTPSKPHTTTVQGYDKEHHFTDDGLGSKNPFKKSDLEHNALGGVTTDTPFDAPEGYEDDKRHQLCNEFQHEKVKEPKDNKQHEILTGKAGEVEKEGGAVTSGTAGVANTVYGGKGKLTTGTQEHDGGPVDFDDEKKKYNKEREIKNKYNTRYGVRQVSKAEGEAFLGI